ncbi:RNA-directed RNA polymerase domain-containing protein [Phanerochaete sordida]|uniref:RNA-directed RNA polymerase domain-containing protein n=1 Tax=Phanerochaete sordida TaxID=48140 RepID=A0A9P3GL64_9APHY|nr:RNA-directed RNA polymerase domain-containing protein [Phanerochaete sordida]
MSRIVLRERPTPEDTSWTFQTALPPQPRANMGLHISFSPDSITLARTQFPQNRILQGEDPACFVLASFERLRFPDTSPRVAQEYMMRFFKEGLVLNGVMYRFHGHSNSQQRSRSCFLRQAKTDEELDERIYRLGDFQKITSAAKRAKRIGLLFSEAKIDWMLDPRFTKDIDDLVVNGETFSDGCGLISLKFAKQLSKHKKILFHGRPYTPSVYQIRYRGYKGVLALEPQLTTDHVHFRKSQKKFTATGNNTFSVVDYSVPFAFGRLNNDIVVLLASLGISTETFLAKQRAYYDWLGNASHDWEAAFDLLCAAGRHAAAERLLLDGADDPAVAREVRALQHAELAALRKNDRLRVRTLVRSARLLFGVCDPYGVLRPGEVHVRIMVPRKGVVTLTNVDVLVVRNPCMYPGDCLKLRAVHHPRLDHLVDCLVFASRGTRAAPSMSSGGDLDGDKFTVIWDPDLVPKKIAQPYDYPAPPERVSTRITRQDLARSFASYNSITMGRVAALHQKWVRLGPAGAMSAECQELNALYSLAVDGGSVKIPERLVKVPQNTSDEPFVLDVLHEAARAFADEFQRNEVPVSHGLRVTAGEAGDGTGAEVAADMVLRLLSSETATMSEYEILCKASEIARRHDIPMRQYFSHIDFSALTVAEKYAATSLLQLTEEEIPYVWNSLVRSDILQRKDLEDRKLGGPLRLQRLYSSSIQGRAAFFEYLKDAMQNYNRRMVLLKTDYRFSAGIFFRGPITWDEDHAIDDNVLACSFMPESTTVISTYKRGVKGWILSCNDNSFQLFNRQRANTFIFITRPPEQSGADIITSIALQNFSRFVQQQYGRMNRTPVVSIEIHVVSNRDRVAQQLFDLRFDYVGTEEVLHRFDHRPGQYTPNSLLAVNWEERPANERTVLIGELDAASRVLDATTPEDALEYFFMARKHRAEDRMFHIFEALLRKDAFPLDIVLTAMEEHPPLAYCSLKRFLHEGTAELSEPLRARLAIAVLVQAVRSANDLGMAALAALERLASDIAALDLNTYLELLWLSSLGIRSFQVAQEVLLVFNDSRAAQENLSPSEAYAIKHALAVVFDRAEEAANECPCDEQGRPRRQKEAPIATKLLPMPPPKEEVDGQSSAAPRAEEQAEELNTPVRVMAHVRVDLAVPIRLHAHVRLKVASTPEHSALPPAIVDGTVVRASRGELVLDILQPLPPEFAVVDWQMYRAGGVVTSKAMLDAVRRLATEGRGCCRFKDIICSDAVAEGRGGTAGELVEGDPDLVLTSPLNDSQKAAVAATALGRMSLIWGPPGTGKTTVVVQILLRFLRLDPEARILMTASTHNAVDNVLERFVAENTKVDLLQDEQILRAATEASRVNKALQKYTVDARLGGNLNENPKLVQKAQKRVKEARIVFTTCTGASLGILRKADFDIVLIDEASQISEPAALIPLVKGSKTAVMVGDHVQLRPTVQAMGKALEFDKSLFERLYVGPPYENMTRNMLEVQYRFPEAIARFPSAEFYEGRLATGNPNKTAVAKLALSSFPWPGTERDGSIFPVAFVPCLAEEDYGRSSKSNAGQANLVKYIITLLRQVQLPEPRCGGDVPPEDNRGRAVAELQGLSIAALTPYSRQVKLLGQTLPAGIVVSTIDGFQGRESDIVVFSTVRSNAEGDLGFVEDARRLNVAWTRPKIGLIIVGDPRTLKNSSLWERALGYCKEVNIPPPDAL